MSIRNDIVNNLIDAIAIIKTSDDYEANVVKITAYDENYLIALSGSTPILLVLDNGNEQLAVEDTTHDRFVFDIGIIGYIRGGNDRKIQRGLNSILASIKQFAVSGPDLGDNVLAFQYVEALDHRISKNDAGTASEGTTMATCRIIYWNTRGTY